MAAISWLNAISGDFNTGADWTGGVAPGPSDDATIGVAGAYTVTIATSASVNSLTLNDADATLAATGTLTMASSLALEAGTLELGHLNGGTLKDVGGVIEWKGAVLNGVTYDGALDMAADNSSLEVTSSGLIARGAGGTGPGLIELTGGNSRLSFDGVQTLDDATIDIGSGKGSAGFAVLYAGDQLTIGTLATVVDVGIYDLLLGQTIINQGTMTAAVNGAALSFAPQSFVNEGSIDISGGADLAVQSTYFTNAIGAVINIGTGSSIEMAELSWSNAGTIVANHASVVFGASVDSNLGTLDISNSAVRFNEPLATAELAQLGGRGNKLSIGSELNNAGTTLTVGTGSALGVIDFYGVVTGGTIAVAGGGAGLSFTPEPLIAEFQDVTYQGNLYVGATSGLAVQGLVVLSPGGTAPGTVTDRGEIDVLGSQSIDNAVLNFGGAGINGAVLEVGAQGEFGVDLVLGAQLVINHDTAVAAIRGYQGLGETVNEGTINASARGGRFDILVRTFVNQGAIEVSNRDRLNLGSTYLTNAASGTITISGATVDAGSFGNWTNSGAMTVNSGGILDIVGPLSNTGTVTIDGETSQADLLISVGGVTLSGGGVVNLAGGKARVTGDFGAGVLTNLDNTISGRGYLGAGDMVLVNKAKGTIEAVGGQLLVNTIGESLVNAGLMEASPGSTLVLASTTVNQSGGGTLLAGGVVDLQGADVIGGALAGAGRFNINSGSSTIDGATSPVSLEATVQVLSGTTLTISGALAGTGGLSLFDGGKVVVGAAGATLSGGGFIHTNNNVLDAITSAVATTLTNVDDKIIAVGTIGNAKMTVVNDAAGVIRSNGSVALTIDTGAHSIINAGLIEGTGPGGIVVFSPVVNSGRLVASNGDLTIDGRVSGAGIAQIHAGVLSFGLACSENVTFTGSAPSGVLALARSTIYAGTISGFSKTGATSLDLGDIAFVASTMATYSGTAKSGVLTVTDGTHTAKIHLSGNYTASAFAVADDGHGGSSVTDSTAPSAAPFSQAMAGLGMSSSAPSAREPQTRRLDHPMLAAAGHAAIA